MKRVSGLIFAIVFLISLSSCTLQRVTSPKPEGDDKTTSDETGDKKPPEKDSAQPSSEEWKKIGSGIIDFHRDVTNDSPTVTSTYLTKGNVLFEIKRRIDIIEMYDKVTGTGTIEYVDNTKMKDCTWEIRNTGTLTLEGKFLAGSENCLLSFNITEKWDQPYIENVTCEGINTVWDESINESGTIEMNFEKDFQVRVTEGRFQEEVYFLREPQADLDTGCAVFDP